MASTTHIRTRNEKDLQTTKPYARQPGNEEDLRMTKRYAPKMVFVSIASSGPIDKADCDDLVS